jgi:hypothetical protein
VKKIIDPAKIKHKKFNSQTHVLLCGKNWAKLLISLNRKLIGGF